MTASGSPFHGPAFDALQVRHWAARMAVDETLAAYQSAKRTLRQPQMLQDRAALSATRQHVLLSRVAWEDAKREQQDARAAMQLYMREQMARHNYGRRPRPDT